MKKLVIQIFGMPKKLQQLVSKVLAVTSTLIAFMESGMTVNVTNLIPGSKDEALIAAFTKALQVFKQQLMDTKDIEARKKLAGEIGKYVTKVLHGKGLPDEFYDFVFEIVFKANKTA